MTGVGKYARILFSRTLWQQLRQAAAIFCTGNVWGILNLGSRGEHTVIRPSASLAYAEHIYLGSWVHINRRVIVWAGPRSSISIGDCTIIGPGTFITSDNHGTAAGTPMRFQQGKEADVIIGDDVWVGASSVILPGVTIGPGAVIAAGAVVTGDIPENAVAAGVPARIISRRE